MFAKKSDRLPHINIAMRTAGLCLLSAIVVLACAAQLWADDDWRTATWTGEAGNWSDAAQWDSDTYPDNAHPLAGTTWWAYIYGDDAVVSLDRGISLTQLSLGTSSGTPTLTGNNTLTTERFNFGRGNLDGGIIVNVTDILYFGHSSAGGPRTLVDATINHSGQSTWQRAPGQAALFINEGSTFNNTGAMGILDPWQFVGSGRQSVFNNSGSMFFGLSDDTISRPFRNMTLNNSGTIVYDTFSGWTDFLENVTLNNSGTITLKNGRIELYDGGETSGTLDLSGQARLHVSNYTFTATSAIIDAREANFNRGITTVAGSYHFRYATLHGLWPGDQGQDAVVHLDGNGTIDTLWLESGVLTGSGTVSVEWFPWMGGTMAGSGTTVNDWMIVMSPKRFGDGSFESLHLHRTLLNPAGSGIQLNSFDSWGPVGEVQMLDGRIDNHGHFEANYSNGDSRFYSAGGTNVIHNHVTGEFVVSIGERQEDEGGPPSVLTIDQGVQFVNDGQLSVERGILRVVGGYQHGATGRLTLGTLYSQGGLEADTIEVHGGTIGGSGTIIGNSHFSTAIARPGNSAGHLIIDGDLLMQGGLLEIELGGIIFNELQQQYDRLTVTGHAALDADVLVRVLLIDQFQQDYHPEVGDVFDILVGSTLSLDAGLQMMFPLMNDGLVFQHDIVDLGSSQGLRLTVVPEPGTMALLAVGGLILMRRKRAVGNKRG